MTKKSVILPIVVDNLPFNAYQHRGFELGVLFTGEKDVYPFLFNFFINIYMEVGEASKKFDFLFYYKRWFLGYDVFETIKYRVKFDMSEEACINIIKEYIGNGYYGCGFFDEYYVPGKKAYNNYHHKHSFLVFGFDEEEEEFHLAGYTATNKYEKYCVKYHDMYNAIFFNETKVIRYRKLNKDFKYEFDIVTCYEELKNHLASIYVDDPRDSQKYGVEANEGFREYVRDTILKGLYVDIRYGRFFAEYKRFMLHRLEYLYNHNLVGDYIFEYKFVAEKYQLIHMLIMKYDISGRIEIGERIDDILNQANEVELRILKRVAEDLEKSITSEQDIELFEYKNEG